MNRPLWIAGLVLALVALGVVGLFVVQNQNETVVLGLDLGFYALRGSQPMQASWLIGLSLLVGFLLGALPMYLSGRSSARKAARLERELAAAGGGASDGWR